MALAGCGDASPAPSTAPATSTPTPSPTPTPEPTLAWGPSEQDLDDAMELAASMTVEELAGQVLVARYSGTDPAVPAALVSDLGVAGVLLFSDNVAGLDGVVDTAAAVQQASDGLGRGWPAIVAVDGEGGPVQRLSGDTGPWTSFPPLLAAGAAGDPEVTEAAAAAMGAELAASGVTMDLAPVADVTIGPSDPTIGVRSAGDDPQLVAGVVEAQLAGLATAGLLAAIKHFPGHGSLTVDSHAALPVQPAGADALADDLAPFEAGIAAGSPMVLMGHIDVTAWDAGVPATLSSAAYDTLRDDLDFTGVAVTDALDMGALAAFGDSAALSVAALQAGADLLLTPADPAAAVSGIATAVDDGTLSRDRLEEAAGRVIAMLRWQQQHASPVDVDAVGDAQQAADDLAAAAMTAVEGPCSGPLVGHRIHLHGGSQADWDAAAAALERHGLDVVPLEEAADDEVQLLASGLPGADADVAIALDWPQQLTSVAAASELAAFGHAPATFDAVAAVLAGEREPPGSLPITVDGLPDTAC